MDIKHTEEKLTNTDQLKIQRREIDFGLFFVDIHIGLLTSLLIN